MTNLTEKLNIVVGNSELFNEGYIVFCFQNTIARLNVSSELVEEALNDAGYYKEDGDYRNADITILCEAIDDFGSQFKTGEILDKGIKFDKK